MNEVKTGIDPRELRIGNRIMFGFEEVDVTVNMLLDIGNSYYREAYSPIPLSENWLKRFGFEDDTVVLEKGPLWFASGGQSPWTFWIKHHADRRHPTAPYNGLHALRVLEW